MTGLIERLPKVRGKYRENASLGAVTWFGVGGPAEVLYKPADAADLADFIAEVPKDIPLTLIGVGSNLLVRDGGVPGVVIRLGRGFTDITVGDGTITAGAGALDVNVAEIAAGAGLANFEFMCGIPGTVGGALRMNAGAYGSDISEILISATAITETGTLKTLDKDRLGLSYRHCDIPQSWIFISAVFQGVEGDEHRIRTRMNEIRAARSDTQPVKTRTGGSTFANPAGKKAWQLIDQAGCRGLSRGDATVSGQHCNFLINRGHASADDLEQLGEEVRRRVKQNSGIELRWEIRRIGIAQKP